MRDAMRTSGRFLTDFIACEAAAAAPDARAEAGRRAALARDVYIKSASFAFLNKFFFWAALGFGACVLAWPAIVVIRKAKDRDVEALQSPVIQTTLTAVAALCFAMYSHYKQMQSGSENLIRYIAFSDATVAELSALVIDEMARIDRGFDFSAALGARRAGEPEAGAAATGAGGTSANEGLPPQ
ncbi:MAG: hypothetical protein AB7Q97_06365 [Gammaproteobacteria bacterium]